MGLQATMLTLKRLMSVFKNRWYCNTNGSMALDILTNVNCADCDSHISIFNASS